MPRRWLCLLAHVQPAGVTLEVCATKLRHLPVCLTIVTRVLRSSRSAASATTAASPGAGDQQVVATTYKPCQGTFRPFVEHRSCTKCNCA